MYGLYVDAGEFLAEAKPWLEQHTTDPREQITCAKLQVLRTVEPMDPRTLEFLWSRDLQVAPPFIASDLDTGMATSNEVASQNHFVIPT